MPAKETRTHVHVQCKHGFVLISGERDDTLKPVCYNSECKAEGERWLRGAGLTQSQMVGAINLCKPASNATHNGQTLS